MENENGHEIEVEGECYRVIEFYRCKWRRSKNAKIM
jgi:hypothetical protein